jgi:hypothetical protein
MRDAGLALVDTLSEGGTNPKIKFGLVPFAKLVHVSLDENYVVPEAKTGNGTWGISDGIWTGCTQDRKWPHNISDATPNTNNENTMWGLTPSAGAVRQKRTSLCLANTAMFSWRKVAATRLEQRFYYP